MLRSIRLLVASALLAAAVLVPSGQAVMAAPPSPKPTVQPSVGEVAPEIQGQEVDGKKFKLSDYRGKVVVLDFWGNW